MISLLNFGTILAIFASITFSKQIENLPGLKNVNFKQYSGYLNGSATHKLHYWFAESASNPSKDPLILWMNGGPGCSSIAGFLTENGPFIVKEDGETLKENPHSWNKMASFLALEAPAGVGYSYSTDGSVATNDNQTAQENYAALKQFFQLFPQLRNNDFYVFGESYGGIYVPTLVSAILNGQSTYHINIKGFGIGNGLVSMDMDVDTSVKFAYSHGFIDERRWRNIEKDCCGGCSDSCPFHSATGSCKDTVAGVMMEIWSSGLNPYNLYKDCYYESDVVATAVTAPIQTRFQNDVQHKFNKTLTQIHDLTTNRVTSKDEVPPCLNETAVTVYMNRKDVRKALSVPSVLRPWSVCSFIPYTKQVTDVTPQYRQALNAKLRILMYYGDVDMACNFLMGQRFAESLNLRTVSEKKEWKFGRQIAGFVTEYEQLTFSTIKASGHMVPQDKPGPMFQLLKKWLKSKPIY